MAVITKQMQALQIGTIRLGCSTPGRKGGKQPQRSDTIRLTSSDRYVLDEAAKLFDGTVSDFPTGEKDKFLLVTTRTEIPIAVTLVEPTQWMEHWDNGLKIRCDGVTICGPWDSALVGKPCWCSAKFPNPSDRYEAAKNRQACKIVTRVSVRIPGIPDVIGVWRFDTHSDHAAGELMMTLNIIQGILKSYPGEWSVPCFLRIEMRKNGKKQPYPVPIIILKRTIAEITSEMEASMVRRLEGPMARLTAPAQQQLTTGTQKQLEAPDDDGDHIDTTFNSDDPEGVFRNDEE